MLLPIDHQKMFSKEDGSLPENGSFCKPWCTWLYLCNFMRRLLYYLLSSHSVMATFRNSSFKSLIDSKNLDGDSRIGPVNGSNNTSVFKTNKEKKMEKYE